MLVYNSKTEAKCSSPGFYNYLNGLLEEFEVLSNTTLKKSSRPSRFNIYLGALKGEFELMAGEIASLQKERDEYREQVEVQAKELRNVRNKAVWERYSKMATSARRTPASSQLKTMKTPSFSSARHIFRSKLSGEYAPWQGIDLPQKRIHHSSQRMILTRKLQSVAPIQSSKCVSGAIARPSDTIVTPLQILPLVLPPLSVLTGDNDSGAEQHDWSSTFYKNAEKELDVETAHVLSHGDTIECVKFSRDGKHLAAGCHDGKAYIYDVETGNLTRVLGNLLAERDSLTGVCFSRAGEYLATSSSGGRIYVWEIKTKFVRNIFKGHTGIINTLDFSPDGRLLVSASYDNNVRLWSMRYGPVKVLVNHSLFDIGCSTSAVFSSDGVYVAASNFDGIVRIWVVRTGQLIKRVKAHTDWMFDVAFMPDGEGLVTGGFDKTLKYWDIGSLDPTLRARSQTTVTDDLEGYIPSFEEPTQEFPGHKDSVNAVAISPDGRWVASASDDKTVRIWDHCHAAVQCVLNHDHWVLATDFSPAGHYLASGGLDKMVRIWKYSCEVIK